MAITSKTEGAWLLNKVYKKINAGRWKEYDSSGDPMDLWAWGNRVNGTFGDSTSTGYESSPIFISDGWKFVNTVNSLCFGIKTDNTLWTWGINSNGRLGLNDTLNRSSPTQVPGLWKDVNISNVGNFMMGIKEDNTLWTWGNGTNGKLGLLTNEHRSSPTQIPGNWVKMSCGGEFGAAIRDNDTLWAWGVNNGQLGQGNTINRSSPVQIPGVWIDVFSGNRRLFAIRDDETTWCCGSGVSGSLGLNNTTNFSSPVLLVGSWKKIFPSVESSLASSVVGIRPDNTMFVWGGNSNGELGVGDTQHRSSPVQLAGLWLKGIIEPSIGRFLRSDNTFFVSGSNSADLFQQGDSNNRSSPVQVPGVWRDLGGGHSNRMHMLK